jgi:hypothetical protein
MRQVARDLSLRLAVAINAIKNRHQVTVEDQGHDHAADHDDRQWPLRAWSSVNQVNSYNGKEGMEKITR